ncbi:protein pangolin, isoforms A/H/I/S isoform X5 [Calliphora vicina]|uniref:protein pangolin, isoforms A/H/I/S isoform X5 n=1 Tax=Calliphora vicina TaxID=7373 RepID=UPI00325AABEA
MPHTSHTRHTGSSGDDLGSTDEVKIFKDEGDREDEKISSENLLVEEKSSLIDLTESEEKSGKISSRSDHSPVFSKIEPHASSFNMGYLVSPYTYSNGGAGGLPVTMANKIGLPPFFCHNGDHLTTPPPAHCGIPPYQLDPKAMGLTRPAIYPFPSGQYPYPMLSPDMSQVASWHTPSVYSAASSFRSPYPSSLPINTTLSSDFPFRFSPSLLPSVHTSPHHVLNSHPAIVTSGPKQECNQDTSANHRYSRNLDNKNSSNLQGNDNCKDNSSEKKKPHIKKPLNAFMLYMKEMRAKVVAECTLKESAAINQILGRRWHALGREEQAKYYELARRERQLHMQMYPDWSSRTNASRGKKRKRKQDNNADGGNNMKKCRARFGLDQQNQWCKPCSPSLSALTNSGSASSGVGGVSVGMGSGSMINTVVTGIGGTVMLPNSSSSSSSSSSTSSSNHMHLMNAAVVGSTGGSGGANSQCSTNGTNNNNNNNNHSSTSLNQTHLHKNNNAGINANGTTNLSGSNCGANVGGSGGPQQASPQGPPTYVNL